MLEKIISAVVLEGALLTIAAAYCNINILTLF